MRVIKKFESFGYNSGVKVSEVDKMKSLSDFKFNRISSDIYGYYVLGKRTILPHEEIKITKEDDKFDLTITRSPGYYVLRGIKRAGEEGWEEDWKSREWNFRQSFTDIYSLMNFLVNYQWYDVKKYSVKESVSISKYFGITYDQLSDVLNYITDEFPQLEYYVEDCSESSLVENDSNCFVVIFNESLIDYPTDLPALYYVEPRIFSLINDVNDQLKQFGLYIYTSDFGQNDAYYELVISKIGHEPKPLQTPKRY
jgi:hypothetical protein